jgi:citrate lyase subunit beta/citryl-CoA lyase
VAVRVNGIDTPWFAADIAAVAASAAHAIVLPKVSDAGVVREASARLGWLRAHAGLDIWIMAETAGGILRLGAIGAASPRVRVIVMGTADLASALRTPPDPGRTGLLAALGLGVLQARAQGLDILDGVYPDVTDVAGFTAECRQGKALGFDGKTLIHPGQIGAANDAFGVSAEAARTATAVIAAYEEAAARGSGIALLEGRMVEKLHADEARRLLALHQATSAANAGQD